MPAATQTVLIKVTIYADDKDVRKYLLNKNFTCCVGGKIDKNKIYHVHDHNAIKKTKAIVFIQQVEVADPIIYSAQFKHILTRKFGATRAEVTCSSLCS